QKPLEAQCRLSFAGGPGHHLHANAAQPAVHPSHRVDEEHGNAPQRNVLELAPRECVVTRPASRTSRADWPGSPPTLHLDLDHLGRATLDQGHPLIDERSVLFDVVEDSLDKHPALSGSTVSRQLHLAKWGAGMPEKQRERETSSKGRSRPRTAPESLADQSPLNQIHPQILRQRPKKSLISEANSGSSDATRRSS